MTVFVDTSALYALLDADDRNHASAARTFEALIKAGDDLVTTNYVVVETMALVQHRLGVRAARDCADALLPLFHMHWVDEKVHTTGMNALLAAGSRGLSLVDCVSFACMRAQGLRQVFAFDRHFARQGFEDVRRKT